MKSNSDLPMKAMSIITQYLPGITLEKTSVEFVFSRGRHNVGISHLDERCFFKDEKQIAREVINSIVLLEVGE